MKTPKTLDLTITEKMVQEYAAGSLCGWLDMDGHDLLIEQIAEQICAKTGRRVVQKHRGVTVWE